MASLVGQKSSLDGGPGGPDTPALTGAPSLKPTYPGIVEGDPVFHPVSESLEAQVGKLIEVVDHADVLPAAIFLLQHLWSSDSLLV